MISGCALNHGLEKVHAQKCGTSVHSGCAWFMTDMSHLSCLLVEAICKVTEVIRAMSNQQAKLGCCKDQLPQLLPRGSEAGGTQVDIQSEEKSSSDCMTIYKLLRKSPDHMTLLGMWYSL